MAASSGIPLCVNSLQQNVVSQVSSPRGGPPAAVQSFGGGDAYIFPEVGKVRELALQTHGCLFQAQQLKMATVQQQQPSASANQQVRSCSVACPAGVLDTVFTDSTSRRNFQSAQGGNTTVTRRCTW